MASKTTQLQKLAEYTRRLTLQINECSEENSHRHALVCLSGSAQALAPELGEAIEELRLACNESSTRGLYKRLGVAA